MTAICQNEQKNMLKFYLYITYKNGTTIYVDFELKTNNKLWCL